MTSTDGKLRCGWGEGAADYLAYHDTEWGVPARDERRLFEFILLEGAQAGLSWSTILRKREGYARCFAGFDPALVAAFDDGDVDRCLADPGIVRNRSKVTAAVGNARAWVELDDPVGFLWAFVDGAPIQNHWTQLGELPATTAVSDEMSKALRKRGFRFVGPTICYAFMQACGFVNDHLTTCFRHSECAALA
jgi:DNA-3-methyladenine glycosylase I